MTTCDLSTRFTLYDSKTMSVVLVLSIYTQAVFIYLSMVFTRRLALHRALIGFLVVISLSPICDDHKGRPPQQEPPKWHRERKQKTQRKHTDTPDTHPPRRTVVYFLGLILLTLPTPHPPFTHRSTRYHNTTRK
jgi:hypothetical protein